MFAERHVYGSRFNLVVSTSIYELPLLGFACYNFLCIYAMPKTSASSKNFNSTNSVSAVTFWLNLFLMIKGHSYNYWYTFMST